MDEQVNPLERDHSLSVVLPGGLEKTATVHGSKPVMDLLVTLCASYHLNPADYTVEVLSPNKNNISFKPNSPIGSLEAEKIVLKPRGVEEKIKRPYMPEASVRLLINYNKSHKAVVRVNPKVPLEMLLPVVCDKCEFKVETTVLLRDSQSEEPLDSTKSLNDHGLREVFAKDTAHHQPQTPEAAVTPTESISPLPLQDLPKKKKKKKEKENTGFLSLFRRKKQPEKKGAVSAPASPGLNNEVDMNAQGVSSTNTLPADMRKKRRAPPPPLGASQSVPNNLSTCHRSAESTLRSTKRRAPPPPCANGHQELQTQVKDSLNTVEELRESDDSVYHSVSSSSSPYPSLPRPSSSPSRPSFYHFHDLPSFRGKDLSDARCALAKVLTSSMSQGKLVKRLRNSANFPKLYNGSYFMSTSPRCSDNGVFCAELEPVLTSNLPTEPEWEDPAQKTRMTTFKVVPSKKQKSHDRELSLDVPGQITLEEAPPEVGNNPTETDLPEEHGSSSETEMTLQSPEPSSQEIQASEGSDSLPPPLDSDYQPTKPEPSPQEIQASDIPASCLPPLDSDNQPTNPEPSSQEFQPFHGPPPLDLDNQDRPGSPLFEVGDTVDKQEEEPETTSEVIPAAPSDCSDEELPSNGQINSEDQSQSPQSPSGQSVSTDKDHCGLHTDEKEAEEVVVEEEDSFPPPPPPVFFSEDTDVLDEDTTASFLPSSPPQTPTSNGQTNAFSEDRQTEPTPPPSDQPAVAPKPLDKRNGATSRFAQAVALAVQRSRLHSRGKGSGSQDPGGPHSTLPSPPRSIYQFGA